MIAELIIATIFTEAGRMCLQVHKERKRQKEVNRLFIEALDNAVTWGDMLRSLKKNEQEHPELYEPVPQTWMHKFFWKDDDE